MEILARLDQHKHPVPGDVETDSTTLASWIYSNVFTKPNLDAIYEHTRSAYADEYDGNIVRVTPGYFTQLDKLTVEAKRALVALYAPYSGRERRNMRVLELGFGTGALTGRIMRMCSEFLDQMQTGTELGDLPSIEIEGWDANSSMVKIATTRLKRSIRRPISRMLYPDLRLMKYEPDSYLQTGDRYDLIVGSFVTHYWMDFYPNGPVTSPTALSRFTGFLSSLRDQLLAPGGSHSLLMLFMTEKMLTMSVSCGLTTPLDNSSRHPRPIITLSATNGSSTPPLPIL
jgi:SAM-dependent methyltransferase